MPITYEELKASVEEYKGDIFKANWTKGVSNAKDGKTSWLYLLFKKADGTVCYPSFEADMLVAGSYIKGAPTGKKTDSKETKKDEKKQAPSKYMTIAFYDMDAKKIEGGDFTPRTMPDKKSQDAENKRMEKKIHEVLYGAKKPDGKIIHHGHIKNMQILKWLNDGCVMLINTLLKKNVKKLKEKRNLVICKTDAQYDSYKTFQIVKHGKRVDGEFKEFDHPLYRLRIPVNIKTRDMRLESYDGRKGGYVPVFHRTVKKKLTNVVNGKEVPQKDTNGNFVYGKFEKEYTVRVRNPKTGDIEEKPLTVKNATSVVTYKSRLNGEIAVRQLSFSTQGASMDIHFVNINIIRHKKAVVITGMSQEAIEEMDDEDIDDVDEIAEEEPVEEGATPNLQSQKTTEEAEVIDDNTINKPHDSDAEN